MWIIIRMLYTIYKLISDFIFYISRKITKNGFNVDLVEILNKKIIYSETARPIQFDKKIPEEHTKTHKYLRYKTYKTVKNVLIVRNKHLYKH